ncbi:MAG: RHS repeat-associated core domain-containing protein, partial [Kiritimatiellia bacterium]
AGPAAGLNPFRFSSEVWDGALGLVCYTFRPYNPLDGRFLQRDPIGEQGGLNLYGFAGNDPVNVIDSLGLESYSIFYGAGPADGVASIAKAAEQVRTYMAKFQPDDDKNDNMICMVKIENNISSSRLRWASTVYNELFFFGHGRKDTRINPNWKTGQPLKEREQIVGTNIMFSDGLFHLDKVLTEEKEKITASIIYPYVCYDEFVSEGNPSGIKVCKLANNPNPNPSAIGNMTLITLMLEKFKTKKCCRLEIQ